jgi:hypothetical protein
MNRDETARLTLNGEEYYERTEWIDVEAEAWAMREAYLSLGLDPVEWAGDLNVSLQESCEEDWCLDEASDLLRADLAMAAALVFAGRVQGV